MNNNIRYFGKTQPQPNHPQPQPQQIQVDLKNAIPKVCSKCDCEYFIPVIKLYTVSALVSPTGQELIANQQVLVCHDCGELVA